MKKIFHFIIVLSSLFYISSAFCKNSFPSDDLRIGVIEEPPYVFEIGGQYSGIAVDMWSHIASKANLKYHFIPHPNPNLDDAINRLAEGEYDVLIGPVSLTEKYIRQVDYTLPYYLSQIGILVVRSEFSFVENLLLTVFYTVGILAVVLFFIFIIHIHILWFTERRRSHKLSGTYAASLERIFWGYISEGKYIDNPKSWKAKIAVIFWVIIIYILLTLIHGSIISFMTVAWFQFATPIQAVSDLANKKIAADIGSKAYHLALDRGLDVHGVRDIKEGVALLKKRKIDAYIAPSAEADYYLQNQQEFDVILSPAVFHNDLYYFATPINSSLRRIIDVSLSEFDKNNLSMHICRKYLTERAKNCSL